jgi:hypothetical protein
LDPITLGPDEKIYKALAIMENTEHQESITKIKDL